MSASVHLGLMKEERGFFLWTTITGSRVSASVNLFQITLSFTIPTFRMDDIGSANKTATGNDSLEEKELGARVYTLNLEPAGSSISSMKNADDDHLSLEEVDARRSESALGDTERKPSVESMNDGARISRSLDDDIVSQIAENEDHVLFQNVTYLGAATVRSPRSETEIIRNLAIMSSENHTSVLVDLLIPRVPQGMVVLYEPQTEEEMAKYPVFRIIFCARGGKHSDPLALCFAFTFGHGSNEEAVFLCHAFRCHSIEQVSKIIMCFSSAFRKPVASQLPMGESVFVFDVCLEVKEDDGRGGFSVCPRESRDCFKVRIQLTVNTNFPQEFNDLCYIQCRNVLLRVRDAQGWAICSYPVFAKGFGFSLVFFF